MAESKVPARRPGSLPSTFSQIGTPADLPAGNHWLGFQSGVLARNTAVVERSADYLDARRRQSDSYSALIDARMRIARKLAELADLPNVIAEDQRQREHARLIAEDARLAQRVQAVRTGELGKVRHDTELARLQEERVRAERNLEAAQRVKEAEIDRWYAEAQARKNNALVEREDTAADLNRTTSNAGPEAKAAADPLAHTLALLDHQIEIERQRGNTEAAAALINLRARLKGSP
jgi:hypothetical protein